MHELWRAIQTVAATSMHAITYRTHLADARPVHAGRDLILVLPVNPAASIGWINGGLRKVLDGVASECYATLTGQSSHRYSVRAITAERARTFGLSEKPNV